MISDTYGNRIEWHWGLAGQGLTLSIHDDEHAPLRVYLRDDQVEALIRFLCAKVPGEYVPHDIWNPTDPPMTEEQRQELIAYTRDVASIAGIRGMIYDRVMDRS